MARLRRGDLPPGGFAGVREHRLVKAPALFGAGANRDGSWPGMGNFAYLADAWFIPGGETGMHPHREIDVISVIVEGRILHRGSLGEGRMLDAGDVQVQRAGGEGFRHNEVNPDQAWTRMIQLWVIPESPGEPAGYRLYSPNRPGLTRVYGGPRDQVDTFPAQTRLSVARLDPGGEVTVAGPSLIYLVSGGGRIDGEEVCEGDLTRGEGQRLEARETLLAVVAHAL